MMSDNTGATRKRDRQGRGFTAFLSEGMSDKTCSLTSGKPRRRERFVNRFFLTSIMRRDDDRSMIRNCVQARHCEVTVTLHCHCLSVTTNENAVPKDRRIPGPECRSQSFDGVFQYPVDQVGVDLGGGQVSVSEGPLHNQDVAGSAVEMGGERMPQGVGSELFVYPRGFEPVFEPSRDLALGQARPAVGEKQRRTFPVTLAAALFEITAQEGAKIGL